jgi:hypothetical protein
MQQRLRFAVLAIALSAAQACYTYTPLVTSPSIGEVVTFQITDQGRVGLSDRFGPGLARIEGLLTAKPDSVYVVNVYSIAQVDGSTSQWSSETVRLPQAYVGSMQSRQFDRKRTTTFATIAAVAAGGTIAAVIANGLFGGYSGGTPIDTSGGNQKNRIPVLRPPIRPIPH